MDGASAARPPAHLILRESTRAAHDAAEASAGMRRLLGGELDEAGYRRLLVAQWGLFREWEAERGDWLEALASSATWHYISRASALHSDLAHECIPVVQPFAAPLARWEPTLSAMGGCDGLAIADRVGSHQADTYQADTYQADTRQADTHQTGTHQTGTHQTGGTEAAWGELYVIEGSTLGARIIVKRLREHFPGLPHHFYGIGEYASPPWHRFQAILDAALIDDTARQAALDGALRMFARFQQALQDDPRHG